VLTCGAATAGAEPLHLAFNAHFAQPPTTAECESEIGIACYGAPQMERAYDMGPLYQNGLTGTGKTIVIVDAFGSPTITQDLQTFDQTYGLPAPPSFKIIQPAGPVTDDLSIPDDANWGVETSLDVEYAHTMAPGANILLVETPVDETEGIQGFPQIVQAENYVIDHHLGDVISQSFAATEQTFTGPQQIQSLRSAYFNAAFHNVSVLAGSGDQGATNFQSDLTNFFTYPVVAWPASDPLVTAVGGTQLHLDANGNRLAPDNVWNDTAFLAQLTGNPPSPAASGGGVSSVFTRPFYQDSVARTVGRQRGIPDISLSAAVNGGVNVYWSYDSDAAGIGPGWNIIGGTSEATPLFSGVVAIADQAAHRDLGLLNPRLYALGDGWGSGITDITQGTNTVTFVQPSSGKTITVPGYNATRGYDLASGLGTPDGAQLVAQLAGFRRGYHRR
jgi:subtilase family serine protease